jgi:antibiotic biosynthesis monooxygenase (ABM) superfamily enzyme
MMDKRKSGRIEELLSQQDESNSFEFKREINLESEKEKSEFAKDVSALANTFGGFILFGKEDERQGGRMVGIDPQTYDADKMQQVIAQRCYPPPVFSSELIERNGKWFAVLEVHQSNLRPIEIVQSRVVWVRRDKTTDRATQKEREEMANKKANTFDAQLETEGIPEEPESWSRQLLIRSGRWLTMKLHKRLDVSLKKDWVAIGILGVLSVVPLVATFLQISTSEGKAIPPQWVLVLSVLLTIVGVGLSIPIIEVAPRLQCPKCEKQFAIRKKHIRMKDKILSKSEEKIVREVTYSNTYQCDFCKHSWSKIEPVTRIMRLS